MSKAIIINVTMSDATGHHGSAINQECDESFELEYELWDALNEISRREDRSIHDLCFAVQMTKPPNSSLEAALRYFIFDYFRTAATEIGHLEAGHGSHHLKRYH